MEAESNTPVQSVERTRSTLNAVIAKAIANGHTLVDIRADDIRSTVTGNVAQCSECLAYLRYYMKRGMGEAYSTACRENPQGAQTQQQTVFGIPVVEDPTIEPNTIILAAEISRANVRLPLPYEGYTLNQWAYEIHQYAKDKGWWDKPESRNFGDLIALLHTEISEAYEEYRNGRGTNERYYNVERTVRDDEGNYLAKPEGIPAELADVMIRLFDMCGYYNINLEEVLIEKHTYNLHRPYRHGGKTS